ncbi:MAG: YCF48-related protein [Nitrospirae bacterium]|nr:YCF48-related protein [Nitrospirota bacterium]
MIEGLNRLMTRGLNQLQWPAMVVVASLFLTACQKPQAVTLPSISLPPGIPFTLLRPPAPPVSPSDKKTQDFIGVLSGIADESGNLVVTGYQGTLLRLSHRTEKWSRPALPIHVDFYGINRTPSGVLWVAGDQGVLLRSKDGGRSWEQVKTGIDHLFLNAISFPTDRVGFAVGEKGVILRTVDGGDHWTRLNSPTKKNLYAVIFADGSHGLVAGWHKRLFRTTDGGSRFTAVDIPVQKVTRQKPSFNSLWAAKEQVLLAGDHGLLFSSSDGGKSFSQIQTGTLHDLYGVCRTGEGAIAVVGEQGTLVMINRSPSGEAKTESPLGPFHGSDFLGVSCGQTHVRLAGSNDVVLVPASRPGN